MSRLLAALSLGLIFLGSVRADNWPQWRGPANDGICNEKNLPTEWCDTKNVLWKLKMPGMAGPRRPSGATGCSSPAPTITRP